MKRSVGRSLAAHGLLALLLIAATVDTAVAQTGGDTILTSPRQRYDAGGLHRFFMGDGHRDLWPVEVPAEVLDLGSFAGGLTVDRLGGGLPGRIG